MTAYVSARSYMARLLASAAAALVLVFSAADARAVIIADSYNDWSFSGSQGENNWINGWYNRTDDVGGVYEITDLNVFNNLGTGPPVQPTGNHWNGTAWDLQDATAEGPAGGPDSQANVPWTTVGRHDVHPNGTNQAAPNNKEHWAVRRWVSDREADVHIDWNMRKTNTSGNGVTGNLYVNGALVESVTIAGNSSNAAGVTRTVARHILAGDIIDLALTPNGADGSDGSVNRLTINQIGGLADSMLDWSTTGSQGENSWFNGYYNRTADPDGTYYGATDFVPFNNAGTAPPVAPNGNHWNGSAWDLQDGTVDPGDPNGGTANVPWTTQGNSDVHPNGVNQGAPNNQEHWTVRRWVADITQPTPLAITWHTRKSNAAGTGVTAKLFVNGAEVDGGGIPGTDVIGLTRTFYYNASPGEVVDLILSPQGKNGANPDPADGSDGSINWLSIDVATAAANNRMRVADSFADFSGAQGQDNWFYGYYNRTADLGAGGDGAYQEGELTLFDGGSDPGFGAWSDTNDWNVTRWDFNPDGAGTGNPPWTEVANFTRHPNDNNPGPEHYAISRWLSEVDGEVLVEGFFRRPNNSVDGTRNIIMHNGVEVFNQISLNVPLNFSLLLDLDLDDRLDFITTTNDPANDGSDTTELRVVIEKLVPFTPIPEPSTVTLAALCGMGLLWVVRRRRS